MEFRQSGAFGSVKTRFAFGAAALEFSEEVGSTARSFSIPYEQIPLERATVTTFSRAFVRFYLAGFLFLAFLLFGVLIGTAAPARQGAAAGNAAAASVLLLIAGRIFVRPRGRITVTVFKTALGSIEVLGDESRDAILSAIDEKRREAVRAKFCQINPASHPQNEMQRFRMLKDKGFISEEELADALRRLSARLPPEGFPPPPAVDPKRPLS